MTAAWLLLRMVLWLVRCILNLQLDSVLSRIRCRSCLLRKHYWIWLLIQIDFRNGFLMVLAWSVWVGRAVISVSIKSLIRREVSSYAAMSSLIGFIPILLDVELLRTQLFLLILPVVLYLVFISTGRTLPMSTWSMILILIATAFRIAAPSS